MENIENLGILIKNKISLILSENQIDLIVYYTKLIHGYIPTWLYIISGISIGLSLWIQHYLNVSPGCF